MRINLDRLCKLAGIESQGRSLNEASNRSYHDDPSVQASDDPEFRFGKNQLSEKMSGHGKMKLNKEMMGHGHSEMQPMEGMYETEDEMAEMMGHSEMQPMEGMYETQDEMGMYENDDEVIEVDEKELVQEIRRAKQMMAEARKRSLSESKKKDSLKEAQLRKMIAEELDSVFKDLNLTSGWVYGKKQPTNRTRGAVNTAFPGIGFRNSK